MAESRKLPSWLREWLESPARDVNETARRKQTLEYIEELEAKLAENKKPLIPLTLPEAKAKNMKRLPLYMECSFTERWHGLQPLNGWVVGLGWMRQWGSPDDEPVGFIEEGYGTYWRCWSGEPTNAEREAAKWQDESV